MTPWDRFCDYIKVKNDPHYVSGFLGPVPPRMDTDSIVYVMEKKAATN